MDSFINRTAVKEQKNSEILVSFDGSSSQFINKYIKSRNHLEADENSEEIQQKHKHHHPKVNLPFFRNNRSKKLKVFNIKSSNKHDEEKHKVLRIADDSIHGDSTQETETNKSNNFSPK